MSDTIEQQFTKARQSFVSCFERPARTACGFRHAAARFVARQQKFAVALMQFFQAVGQRDMAFIQFLVHHRCRLGQGVHDLLIEDQF